MAEMMKAALLVEARKLELGDVPLLTPEPHQVLVRTGGVGICGTDLHIFAGHANYNRDEKGMPIPLSRQPLILGHEITGVVEEAGPAVHDLEVGDRVVLDQGLNCLSQGIAPICEFCASGDSHQCLHYKEHGIIGLPGGFAQFLAIAAVNVIRIEGDLSTAQAALTEPLGCVVHATEMAERAGTRYTFGGERRVRNILILGCGPAGLLLLQYFRNVYQFDGPIFITDISPPKLALAETFGATALDSTGDELVKEVLERTHGEKIYYLVEASGAGAVFRFLPLVLRRQATVVLYGHGHEGADMTLLNSLQFLEPALISPIGASGAFDTDGRSRTYRRSMQHLVANHIQVEPLVTHPCTLNSLPQIFSQECARPHFIKAVLLHE